MVAPLLLWWGDHHSARGRAETATIVVVTPAVSISGELDGFEALARWDHPSMGSIAPDRFVPVIEEIGAAGRLFEHVLTEALGAQAQWAKRLGVRPSVAVNASAAHLGDLDLANVVARALTKVGAPASSLWIEVTESALVEEAAMERLLAAHELGVLLAAFPWDMLKIDRSFVAALGTGRPARAARTARRARLRSGPGFPDRPPGVHAQRHHARWRDRPPERARKLCS